MSPLLAFMILALPCLGAAAYAFRDDHTARNIIFFTALGLIVFYCVTYAAYAIKRPHALESEDFRLRNFLLTTVQQKGVITVTAIDATRVAISNPLLPSPEAQSSGGGPSDSEQT